MSASNARLPKSPGSLPGLAVGSRVGVLFGTKVRAAEIVEDRGPLGKDGDRIVRIRLDFPEEDPIEFEVPVAWLKPAPPSAA